MYKTESRCGLMQRRPTLLADEDSSNHPIPKVFLFHENKIQSLTCRFTCISYQLTKVVVS